MTNKQQNPEIAKEQIHAALLAYQQSKELSLNELAVQTKISSSTLSKIIKKRWDDVSDSSLRKVWVKVSGGKAIIIETRDFAAIQFACNKARLKHLMVGITGDTGTGKSTALEMYSRRKNVYYVVYDKTMKAKQFFVTLLTEMGISYEGSVHEMVNRVADELNSQADPLVVIDEAGKLTHNMILYLHVLRDKTLRNCGIVLAGMPYFQSNMIRNANRQKEGYAEFLRRVNVWHELDGLTSKEIEFICDQNSISEKEVIQSLKAKKRFGDLVNEILLHQIHEDE